MQCGFFFDCVKEKSLWEHVSGFMFCLCMAKILTYRIKGQQEQFNGSHDVIFSLDYRRLDDGSSPGYGNNRWAYGKERCFCL